MAKIRAVPVAATDKVLTRQQFQQEVIKFMATQNQATTDLLAGQAALNKAVADAVTALNAGVAEIKAIAGQIQNNNGVSPSDAEAVASDLNAQASALETGVAALQGAFPPTVTISPATVSLTLGGTASQPLPGTQQFTGTPSGGVFSLAPGAVGTISATGLYSYPATQVAAPTTDTVIYTVAGSVPAQAVVSLS